METRTNIVVNDELVERAMAKAGVTTKKAAIEAALRAYVKAPDWKGLLALSGSGVLADDYDPKQLFTGDPGLRHHVTQPRAAYRAGATGSAAPAAAKRRGRKAG